jgi:phosphoenolpyruvate synthase/pyruvate phosphate dikinase
VLNTAHSLLRILPLQDCAEVPQSEIGQRAVHLTQLYWQKIPLPESYVMPVSFLHRIFTFNHFDEQFEKLFAALDVSKPESLTYISEQMNYLLFDLEFPEDASVSILNDYAQWMEGSYVALRPSFITDIHNVDHLSELHVKGEANVAESLLHLWSRLYQPQYLEKRLAEWKSGQQIPAAVVIQRMIESVASGFALTDEADANGKPIMKIFSTWGVAESHDIAGHMMDKFEIDVLTQKTVQEDIAIKKYQYIHQLDSLDQQTVPFLQQAQSSLTEAQLHKLIELVLQVRQKFLTPHSVEWAIEGTEVYILHIRPLSQHTKTINAKTIESNAEPSVEGTKNKLNQVQLLVSLEAGKPLDPDVFTQTQGLGFVQSEFFWSNVGDHPSYTLHQHKAEELKNNLVKTLLPIVNASPTRPFLYRSQSLMTDDWLRLKHGKDYEPEEKNPYLGYRGAVRILHNYDLFDLELDVLTDVRQETNVPVAIMVPFVRTSSEIALLQRHLSKPKYAHTAMTELWLECDTPENLLHIDQYLRHDLKGICIHLANLHSLLFGLDPRNQDVFKLYPTDFSVVTSLIKQVIHTIKKSKIPVYLYVNQWTREAVDLALELELNGVIVTSKDVAKTQTALKE